MRKIRYSWLTVMTVVAALAGWILNLLATRYGFPAPALQLGSLLTMVFIVAFTLALGLKVRAWRNGKRDRPLDPIVAARTLILAQACAYTGALMFGWHLGILLDQLTLVQVRGITGGIWGSLATIAGGAAMIVIGLLVERFCTLPPDDDASTKDTDGTGNRRSARGDEGEYA